jgi:hypothetical protein
MSVSVKSLPNPLNHCWWNKAEGMGLRSELRCTLLCLHSAAATILLQAGRESDLTLATLMFEVGFRVQRSSSLKVKLQCSNFRITWRSISHMNLVNSSYYSLPIHLRRPTLLSLQILTNSIQKSSSSKFNSFIFIQNLLPFLKSSETLLPFY